MLSSTLDMMYKFGAVYALLSKTPQNKPNWKARKALQMDMSLVKQAVGMQAAQRQHSAELLMMKAAHDMQQQAVNMLQKGLENAKAMPAPGTGTVVDKSA